MPIILQDETTEEPGLSMYAIAKATNPNFRESVQWLGDVSNVIDFLPPNSTFDEEAGKIWVYDEDGKEIDVIGIGWFLHKDREGNVTWSKYLDTEETSNA